MKIFRNIFILLTSLFFITIIILNYRNREGMGEGTVVSSSHCNSNNNFSGVSPTLTDTNRPECWNILYNPIDRDLYLKTKDFSVDITEYARKYGIPDGMPSDFNYDDFCRNMRLKCKQQGMRSISENNTDGKNISEIMKCKGDLWWVPIMCPESTDKLSKSESKRKKKDAPDKDEQKQTKKKSGSQQKQRSKSKDTVKEQAPPKEQSALLQ